MDIEVASEIEGSYASSTIEATASSSLQPIQLVFPTFGNGVVQKCLRRAMVVDRCDIVYNPTCPINATGRVRVYVYDTRLQADDQVQAQYVFLVTCPITLKYYGTSHASLNDKTCPWLAKYKLEESNINTGVRYCRMKAFVKLCTSKNPEELAYRAPEFVIRSKQFNAIDVDCWHVAPAPKQPQLCRTMSAIHTRGQQRFILPAGLTETHHA